MNKTPATDLHRREAKLARRRKRRVNGKRNQGHRRPRAKLTPQIERARAGRLKVADEKSTFTERQSWLGRLNPRQWSSRFRRRV